MSSDELEDLKVAHEKTLEELASLKSSIQQMDEKINVMLEILNTFSIMVSDDDDDEDYDDDDVEDYEDYDGSDDDDDDDDDDDESYDADSTWVPEDKDFWEIDPNDK